MKSNGTVLGVGSIIGRTNIKMKYVLPKVQGCHLGLSSWEDCVKPLLMPGAIEGQFSAREFKLTLPSSWLQITICRSVMNVTMYIHIQTCFCTITFWLCLSDFCCCCCCQVVIAVIWTKCQLWNCIPIDFWNWWNKHN